jgi:uncharacterized protein HemY
MFPRRIIRLGLAAATLLASFCFAQTRPAMIGKHQLSKEAKRREALNWQLAAAESILAQDNSNLVALTIVADSYLQNEEAPQRLEAYARKILTVLDYQPEQEGFASAEWIQKKAVLTGKAHWMIGVASMRQRNYIEADRSLRAALPYLKDDSQLLSLAQFYLRRANDDGTDDKTVESTDAFLSSSAQ